MATKKSKRSASAKKSAKSEAPQAPKEIKESKDTKAEAEETEMEALEDKDNDNNTAEEVVEVVEVEEPIFKNDNSGKKTISEKLAALNPAALIAELLGTFILTGAFIKLFNNASYGVIGIALVLTAVVVAFASISGAHFNPAITLAQWIGRKINGVKAVAYIVAQVLGAILAFFVLTGINNAGYDYNATLKAAVLKAGVTETQINQAGGLEKWAEAYGGLETVASQVGVSKEAPKLSQYQALTTGKEWAAMLAELLGAVIVGLGAGYAYSKRKDNKLAAGVAMGVALMVGLVMAGGTAILNPAIATTMGVFTFSKASAAIWAIVVYVVTPVIGTTIGFLVYNMLAKNVAANAEAIED